jgi:hypothetical protein
MKFLLPLLIAEELFEVYNITREVKIDWQHYALRSDCWMRLINIDTIIDDSASRNVRRNF